MRRTSITTCAHATFVHGRAEAMPFSNASFDVAVNVEASFCYTNMKTFVAEVSRVLRPGGFFAFADLRHKYEVQELRTFFAESAFKVVEEKNISENVIKALELDGSRRMNEVKRLIPKPLQKIFMTYAGAEGSRIPTLLGNGEIVYLRFLLKKPYKSIFYFCPKSMQGHSEPPKAHQEPHADQPLPCQASWGGASGEASRGHDFVLKRLREYHEIIPEGAGESLHPLI